MSHQNGVNKVILVGAISRPPRWHRTRQDGNMLCFILTTTESHRQKGRMVEHAEEHIVKIPEHCPQPELKLGQLLHVEGRLRTIAFTDEEAVRRYKTEVIANKANVLSEPDNSRQ